MSTGREIGRHDRDNAYFWRISGIKGGRISLKVLHPESKMQFENQERNTQNTIALLNYLKRIVLQQLMLRTQVFTKNVWCAKKANAT